MSQYPRLCVFHAWLRAAHFFTLQETARFRIVKKDLYARPVFSCAETGDGYAKCTQIEISCGENDVKRIRYQAVLSADVQELYSNKNRENIVLGAFYLQ